MTKINGKSVPVDEKYDLIYVYNAQCAWCYGFSEAITRINTKYSTQFDLTILSNNNHHPAIHDKDNTSGAAFDPSFFQLIENKCKVRFSKIFIQNVMKDPEAFYANQMPSKALATFRVFNFMQSLNYAHEIQTALFKMGLPVNDQGLYARLAERYNINSQDFIRKFNSEETDRIVENESEMIKNMGVKDCPSVFVKLGKKIDLLSEGCQTYEEVSSRIDEMLSH